MPNESPDVLRQKLAQRLKQYDIIITNTKTIPYGIQWKVVRAEKTAILNTYHGKKGFRLVIQTKDPEWKEELEALATNLNSSGAEVKKTKAATEDRKVIDTHVIGCDESGKGDVLGPLVVAAVYLTKDQAREVVSWGVRDSKELTDLQITKLAQRFLDQYEDQAEITILAPQLYNEKYAAYQKNGKNLNDLLTDLHFANMKKLLQRFPAEQIILDRFAREELMQKKWATAQITVPLLQTPRGERYPAVAMASILARAAFVDTLAELGRKYYTTLPKGASFMVRQFLASFAQKHAQKDLQMIGKWHFSTFDRYR